MGHASRESATAALQRELGALFEQDIPSPRASFEADRDMVLERLDEVHANLLAECRQHGATFTERQSGKWEGAFTAMRAVLVKYLHPMRDAWRIGLFLSHKGERLAGREG